MFKVILAYNAFSNSVYGKVSCYLSVKVAVKMGKKIFNQLWLKEV